MCEDTLKIMAINRDEIESIKTLWESLNAYHLLKSKYFKGHFSEFTFEKRMEDLNKRDHLIAYVAEDENESIGYCIASVDGPVGEIDSLFIKAERRGQGVGDEMMTLALKWLEEQNCETIRVSIAEGNESVLDFYRRFGFAERLIVMQRTHNQKA
jgi:ribosomal protein S18 acetylase RimI-like enzyme